MCDSQPALEWMRSPRCAPSFCAQEIHGTVKRSVRIIYRGAGGNMFCDGCGATVQTGQAFCSRCGKHTIGPVTAIQPRPGRVQAHVHLLGILWLAISVTGPIVCLDRKSTRLNSSHGSISYAVFCLTKKRFLQQAHPN